MGVRPSDLLGIEDVYRAFCLDQATNYLGAIVQEELSKIKGRNEDETNNRRLALLNGLLSDDVKERFAVPTATK